MHIPGLGEAIKIENANRDEAWINLTEEICGIEIEQMTLFHLLLLDGASNCFILGRSPTPAGVAQFLWVVSPRFCYESKARNKFVKKLRKIPYEEAITQINSYLDKTFLDVPSGGGNQEKPLASFISYFIDTFAKEYGWKPGEIMQMPVRQLYQLLDVRSARLIGAKHIKFRPSDKIIAKYLKEKNTNVIK